MSSAEPKSTTLYELAVRMKASLQRELDAQQPPKHIDIADILPFLKEAAAIGCRWGLEEAKRPKR